MKLQTGSFEGSMNAATFDMPLGDALYTRKVTGCCLKDESDDNLLFFPSLFVDVGTSGRKNPEKQQIYPVKLWMKLLYIYIMHVLLSCGGPLCSKP